MKTEHDDFARQHPDLDRALREQIKAPKMDAAFRQQVFARIAAQRATPVREVVSPQVERSRLRARFLLQMLNTGAIGIAAVALIGVAGSRLAAQVTQRGIPDSVTTWLHQAGSPLAIALAVAAVAYGLHRARLFGWARSLGI
ncbi:MAG: hypothetical protein U1F39_05600 [Steroidobacteraceae bacterium]